MALAILKLGNSTDLQSVEFQYNIGTNQYLQYTIGSKEQFKEDGFNLMAKPSFQSELIGPIPSSALGRGSINISSARFQRTDSYIQLKSYRTKKKEGKAVSEMLHISRFRRAEVEALPLISLSKSEDMDAKDELTRDNPIQLDRTRFSFQESAPTHMDTGAFLNIMKGALPKAMPIAALATLTPVLKKLAEPEAIRAIGITGPQLMDAYGRNQRQLIDTIGQHAQIGSTTVTNFLRDALGIQADEKLKAPDVNDTNFDSMVAADSAGLNQLLLNMSAGQSLAKANALPGREKLDYRKTSKVILKPLNLNRQVLNGRPRIMFSREQGLSIPLSVQTPAILSKVLLKISLGSLVQNQAVLLKRTYKLRDVGSGPLSVNLGFSNTELSRLPTNKEYLLKVDLIFQNRRKERIGTSLSEVITIAGSYLYDRTEDTSKLIPLNNVQAHRVFWHKIWAAPIGSNGHEIEINGKYYYTLERDRQRNAQMETLTRFTEDRRAKKIGKLKSGLIISPYQLNALIPRISEQASLSHEELDAVLSDDFVQQLARMARFKVNFDELQSTHLALWVFPEVKLQKVVLKKPTLINSNGLIEGLADKIIYFPIPVSIHCIGTKTT